MWTMLAAHLRAPVTRIVNPVARFLLRIGVTPDGMTIVGAVGVCASALFFYPRGDLFIGTLAITAFIFSDLLDGTMARLSNRTSIWGAFVDSTLDRVADAAIFGALTIYFIDADSTLALLSLISLVGGALVPYIKARAEALGLECTGGLAERTERLIVILVATGFAGLGVPYIAALGLWLLVVATLVTLVQRMWQVRSQLA